MRALTREEVRGIDRQAIIEFGIPGAVLMENAGRGIAERLIDLGINGPVVICAGKGNNGGDGFVIARHLDLHGYEPRVLLFCDPLELADDAAINWHAIRKAEIPGRAWLSVPEPEQLREELKSADWIVDALLGTGFTGGVREPHRTVIRTINESGKKVLAVDLPSGMDCDTGEPQGECIRATQTATLVARKIGFDAPISAAYTGQVSVIHIGLPRAMMRQFRKDANAPWPVE